jgi:hypothetical protein
MSWNLLEAAAPWNDPSLVPAHMQRRHRDASYARQYDIPKVGDLISVRFFKREEFELAMVTRVDLPGVDYVWPDGKEGSTGIASVTISKRA